MQLTIADVAKLCSVPENTAYKWVQEDGLPAEEINGRYRIGAVDLLEWATNRKLPISPAIFQRMNGDSMGVHGLAQAMERAGVAHDVPGADLEAILTEAVQTLPRLPNFSPEMLVELMIARERQGSTALGGGIAIPHPRRPVVLAGAQHIVKLCFLQQPLDFGAADGKPVDTLFLTVCPTVRDHLQVLARLANVLREESFRELLGKRPPQDEIFRAVQRLEEEAFQGSS